MGDTRGFEKAIYFTKWSVYPALGWPPPRLATKSEILKYDIALFISIINTLCTLVPLTYSVYVHRYDSGMVSSLTTLGSGIFSFFIKLLLMRVNRKPMQMLIEEMENFVKRMRPYEATILQRYSVRFSSFHTLISVSTYMGACLVIMEPLVMSDQILPLHAVYPFNVNSGIVMYVVYIQQSVSALQTAAATAMDFEAALVLWYAGARIEILSTELADVTNVRELQYFVRKHKRLMSYALNACNTLCYIVFVSSTAVALAAIMSGIQLISNTPTAQKLPFGFGVIVGSLLLFVSASAADNLIHVSDLLANAVYNTPWIDMSPDMVKSLIIVLQRCQHPITVSIAGLVPVLSLEFYASFLSRLFSCFTTLRVIMMAEN